MVTLNKSVGDGHNPKGEVIMSNRNLEPFDNSRHSILADNDNGLTSVSVLERDSGQVSPELAEAFRAAARLIYQSIETAVDECARVASADGGAFVAAWVWVSGADRDTVLDHGTLTLTTRCGRVGVEKVYRLGNGKLSRCPMVWSGDGDDETTDARFESSIGDFAGFVLTGDQWRELESSGGVKRAMLRSLQRRY